MIFLGVGSFKLASYKPSEFDLPENIDQQFSIERRQRYLYFLFIPTFSLNQVWMLRTTNGQLVIPDSDMLAVIYSVAKPKQNTPWYTYSGLLLLLLAGLGLGAFVYGNSLYRDYLAQQYLKRIRDQIALLNTDYCVRMYDKDYNDYFFKVIEANKDELICLKSNKRIDDAKDLMVNAFMKDDTTVFDTVVLSRSVLPHILQMNKDTYDFIGKPVYEGGPPLQLTDIRLLDYPEFQLVEIDFSAGKFTAKIKNFGAPVTLDQYTSSYDNAKLSIPVFPEKELLTDSVWVINGTYTEDEPRINFEFTAHSRSHVARKYSGRIFSRDVHFYNLSENE